MRIIHNQKNVNSDKNQAFKGDHFQITYNCNKENHQTSNLETASSLVYHHQGLITTPYYAV